MDGTYIREPDGATRILYSPKYWNDPAYARRDRPDAFHPANLALLEPHWRFEVEALAPGEWLVLQAPLVLVGG